MYKLINVGTPDQTYFTMSDVTPTISADGKTITITNGKGARRSWGRPETETTVIVNHGNFAVFHVGFHHKHRGGQGYHYIVDGNYKTWAQLTDAQQHNVYANIAKCPKWAKMPGTLRSERKAAKMARQAEMSAK